MAVTLAVENKPSVSAKELRASGYIPAVIYGPGLKSESKAVSIEYQAFRKAFREAGESTAIEINIDGEVISTLVHSLDTHPVSGEFMNIDFYAMDMNQEVHTHIPIVFVGTAPAVKEKNAVLVHSKESLEVKCLPKYLVHDFKVDIMHIENYHDQVCVKDIDVGEGIMVLDDPEDTVITATAPKLEIEEPSETEAEGEGVEESEGGEGEESSTSSTGDAGGEEKVDSKKE